ncbi:MAG: pseudouridine synthase [Candidatus Lokiarchaeota archaeon]|nr:pseudouridine synthase [Candidatus Harpocratesius repetitus]
MSLNNYNQDEIESLLRGIFTYQFNASVASVLLSTFPKMTFKFSHKTKKLKYIYVDNQIFASYRPQTGTFSLGFGAANLILHHTSMPTLRVVVLTEVQDFIKDGKSVFSQHVVDVDPSLHIGDEVIIVNETDELLAIGKLFYPPIYIRQRVKGSCVKVRKGIHSINSLKE